ncbi:MAG: MarR family transcriptional regulator, partial [Candidatus Dadabacteria bacterium]|nr:MarR family transcriptional regulator [Candidatus Dadabacteria bacterium]
IKRLLLCGVSELAEIASLKALENDVDFVGTFDPDFKKNVFLHLPVWNEIEKVDRDYEACLLT